MPETFPCRNQENGNSSSNSILFASITSLRHVGPLKSMQSSMQQSKYITKQEKNFYGPTFINKSLLCVILLYFIKFLTGISSGFFEFILISVNLCKRFNFNLNLISLITYLLKSFLFITSMSHLSNMSDARIQQIAQDRERIRFLANQLAQSRRLNQQLTDQIRLLEERLNENHLQNQRSVRQIPVLENEILHLTQNNEHLTQQNHQLTLKSHQDQQQLTQLNNQLRIHNETIRQLREEILQKNQLIQNLNRDNKPGQIARRQIKPQTDKTKQIGSNEGRQFLIELSQFRFYPYLQVINLQSNKITDRDLKRLLENAKNFPNLQTINLSDNQITDAGLSTLIKNTNNMLNLKQIYLGNNRITDHGLKTLVETKNLSNLQKIGLSDNQITDAGLKTMVENAKNFPKLRIIYLNKNQITNMGLQALVKNGENFLNIKQIYIGSNPITYSFKQRILSVNFLSFKIHG